MRNRHAFTLIEMVVSSAVVGLIALAVASSVTVALRCAQSTRDTGSAYNQTAVARSAVDQISDDMKAATKIEPLYVPPWPAGTIGVTLTVPARNGDSSPETIVYSWAGAGQPIMRQYNSQTAVSIADNVQNFAFSFSPEQLLVQHDAVNGNATSAALSSTNWFCEYFRPTFPSGTTSWKLTHVKLQLQRSGTSTGTVNVKIYNPDASQKPTGTALATATVDISTVSSSGGAWVDVPISGISGLAPGSGLCIVVGTSSGSIGYCYYDSPATANTIYSASTSGGSSWTSNSGQCLQFYVYGAASP
ncbi:MAG TPA: prepilin-type N-terminal cleavage/methylation domain-containing protein [Humisphaera sp.]|nr:prepilin-type N-terminal cleavage/methylation domain-containing protein [Humisphaera sp.]